MLELNFPELLEIKGDIKGEYICKINVSMIVGPNFAQNTHSSNKNFNFSTYNP